MILFRLATMLAMQQLSELYCMCYVCVASQSLHKPKHLPYHRSSCRRNLGIHNTRFKTHGAVKRMEVGALDCVLVVTFLKIVFPRGFEFFNHLHRCSQLRQSLHCSLSWSSSVGGLVFSSRVPWQFGANFFCTEIQSGDYFVCLSLELLYSYPLKGAYTKELLQGAIVVCCSSPSHLFHH